MIKIIALTLDFVGKILIGFAVLLVHFRVTKAKKIDMSVLRIMRKEQILAIVGMVLMTAGYILHLYNG